MKPQKYVTISTTKRVGYDGIYFAIVPDHGAGRRGRYTVYALPAHPTHRTHEVAEIIGRELTLGQARKVIESRRWEND